MLTKKKKYLIVGNGRLAFHLQKYFKMCGIDFKNWDRHSNTKNDLKKFVLNTDIILLAISDSAIEYFIKDNISVLVNRTLIHFSGVLITDSAYGFHPMMTFSNMQYDLEFYKKILFVVDEGAPEFKKIFPTLKNPNIKISLEFKSKYHALCVMANNFTTILWQKFFTDMISELNIEKKNLLPFMEKTFENICDDHENCLTGPLVRDDKLTIKKNIDSLEGDLFQDLYKAFVNVYKKRK